MSSLEQLVTLAGTYNATGIDYPGTTETYLDLIGPADIESAQTRGEMLLQSSCAQAVRGLWRKLGSKHPRLLAPYRNGKAPADVREVARDAGAIVKMTGKNGPKLQAGFSYYILHEDGSNEHFGTILEELPSADPNAWVFRTFEGGQGTHGSNCEIRVRTFRVDASKVWAGDRRVIEMYDLTKVLGESFVPDEAEPEAG